MPHADHPEVLTDPYQAEDLVNFGTISPEAVGFLKACVMARANLLISADRHREDHPAQRLLLVHPDGRTDRDH